MRLAWLPVGLVLVASAGRAEIVGPMVVSDRWPQAGDLATWAADVLRIEGKTDASERDKALALYYWTRLFVMSPKAGTEPYEGPFGAEARLVEDVTKVMFVHGCGDCDYQARALEAVWCLYQGDDLAGRRVNLMPHPHTMTELRWDGAWHAFDPMNGVFFLASDSPTANVLSFAEEVHSEPLLRANEHFEHRARPFFERVRPWEGSVNEWSMHLALEAFFESGQAWLAAGSPPATVFATHSLPSTLPMSDLDWFVPRGTRVERRWSADETFFAPAAQASYFGPQGRHYRAASEWDGSVSHWNAEEDRYNFPKVEPYLTPCSDAGDLYFHGQHTLYLVGSGTQVYEADLWSEAYLDAVEGEPGLVRSASPPYLRPDRAGEPRAITFEVRVPYVIADAEVEAAVARGPRDSARLLLSTDGGLSWDELSAGTGAVSVNLGRERFDGRHQSVCGKYGFLLRFECEAASDPASVGLGRLRLSTHIDGSLNALPRLEEGANTVRFKVREASAVVAPVEVEYRWMAGESERRDSRTLLPEELRAGEASYGVDAAGLTKLLSYGFAYDSNDSERNGLPDSWERYWFGCPGQAPEGDPDGDGLGNLAEFHAGTSPGPPSSSGCPASESKSESATGGCGASCGSSLGAMTLAFVGLALALLGRSRRGSRR